MYNPSRSQRQTTPLRMLPNTFARITLYGHHLLHIRGTLRTMKFLIVKPCPFRMEFKAPRFISVKDRKKVALISVQHSQEEKTDQSLIQGEGNGKPLFLECCLVHPHWSPGILRARRTLYNPWPFVWNLIWVMIWWIFGKSVEILL